MTARVAIIYDFDKTLSPRDMQEYGLIPDLGMQAPEFWQEVNQLIDDEGMDGILAYTFLLVAKSRDQHKAITQETFQQVGKNIQFFKGVLPQGNDQGWFARINAWGAQRNLEVEHYIVSSGIKEIIDGTPIASEFKKVYACEFLYDDSDCIEWPKQAINYTTKTQFIFRINKGVLDITHDSDRKLNAYTKEQDRRIPFTNMIYIGDGFTDVPCMKLVKSHGGHSIAVFDPEKEASLFTDPRHHPATELLRTSRVNTIVKADYQPGSQLENIVKVILEKISADTKLQATVEPFRPLL